MSEKMKIFTVLDIKAESYGLPFFSRTFETAIRDVKTAVNTEGNKLMMHPEDYTLWFIGEFDVDTAALEPSQPNQIARCMDLEKEMG